MLWVFYTRIILVVPRDWNKSYYWIKKSSDGGFEPAKEVLIELSSKVSEEFKDSVQQEKFTLTNDKTSKENKENLNIQPSVGLVFIDFDTQSDTVKEITDDILISDLKRLELNIVKDSLIIKNDSTLTIFSDKHKLNLLRQLAEYGSHEAQTILGRLYEQGNFVVKNKLLAAEYYIRATILDSPRSAYLLWKLIREKDFYNILNNAVQLDNPTAQFVWYGLQKLGYDNRLTEKDAIDLLQKASAQNHIPAIIELGFNYYSGKYVKTDMQKGLEYWKAS